MLFRERLAHLFNPSIAALTVPGGQIWASGRVDPYGTNYLNSIGPNNPIKLWVINNSDGFSGNPTVSADGTIYAASLDSRLLAINPDGTSKWESNLPVMPLGPLAIGPQGIVYVNDKNGGLSAFSPDGNLLWSFTTDEFGQPNHGSVVTLNGTILYLLEDFRGDTLFALSPNGELLWSIQPDTRSVNSALRLSPDGQQVYIKNVVVNISDGARVDITLPTENSLIYAKQAQLFVGADGKSYLLGGHVVMQWTQTAQGFSVVQDADWNYRGAGISQTSSFPADAGVDPRGNIWLFYSGFYGGTFVYWLDPTGKILGNFSAPFFEGTRLVAMDGADMAVICGIGAAEGFEYTTLCQAYELDSAEPLWSYLFGPEAGGITGAAMAPGRLYVITGDGNLTALGDAGTIPAELTSTP
jgi:hypothetical protein